MSELDISAFKAMELPDKNIFENALKQDAKILCNFNFQNLFIWGGIFKTLWKTYKERLIIYGGDNDLIYMPVGKDLSLREIIGISDDFKKQGKSGNYIFFDADYAGKNKELSGYFRIESDRNNADYIYSAAKLVELKGKRLHKKKNLVSQFTRNNPGYTIKNLEKQFFGECFRLAEKWCKARNCDEIGFTHETSALKRAFDNFKELGFEGLLVFTGDRMAAFSVFSRQNNRTADVHFEKYDSEIKGSGQVICWETAKLLQADCEFINREEDMGLEGLRQSKLSYDPGLIVIPCKLYRL